MSGLPGAFKDQLRTSPCTAFALAVYSGLTTIVSGIKSAYLVEGSDISHVSQLNYFHHRLAFILVVALRIADRPSRGLLHRGLP